MKKNHLLGKDGIPIIDFIAVIFFSVYYILPSASGSLNSVIAIFLGFMYFGYLFFKDRKTAISFISIFAAVVFIAFAYAILTDTKTISQSASNRELKIIISKFSQFFFMYFPALLLIRMLKTANQKQKTVVLALSAVLFAVVIYNTLQELAINPYAVRQWETFEDLEDENIGNYYFVYAVPIVMVGISVCASKLKGISKILSIVTIAFLFYFLFQAQYTLAILIAALDFALQIFISLKSPVTKIMFGVVAIIAMFFVPDLLLSISKNVDSHQMAVRFRELYNFFASGDTSGYNLNGRLTLYWRSILAFIQSPIIGNRSLDFDGHATCFTVLSDTGIIGGIPFYYLLFSMNKRVKALLGENAVDFLPAFFCLLCMGFSNPIHSSLPLAFSVWFIVPLIIDTVLNKDGVRTV